MSKHEKLFRKMQQTANGWRQSDIHALYLGYGFEQIEGGNHTGFQHPKYVQLRATVPRHNQMLPCYARDAVKIITQLLALEAAEAEKHDEQK